MQLLLSSWLLASCGGGDDRVSVPEFVQITAKGSQKVGTPVMVNKNDTIVFPRIGGKHVMQILRSGTRDTLWAQSTHDQQIVESLVRNSTVTLVNNLVENFRQWNIDFLENVSQSDLEDQIHEYLKSHLLDPHNTSPLVLELIIEDDDGDELRVPLELVAYVDQRDDRYARGQVDSTTLRKAKPISPNDIAHDMITKGYNTEKNYHHTPQDRNYLEVKGIPFSLWFRVKNYQGLIGQRIKNSTLEIYDEIEIK